MNAHAYSEDQLVDKLAHHQCLLIYCQFSRRRSIRLPILIPTNQIVI